MPRKARYTEGQDMNDDTKTITILTSISEQVGEMSGMMKSVLTQLADHAFRIRQLEMGRRDGNALDPHERHEPHMAALSKDIIIKWLAIGLLVSLGIIATLTGSAAFIRHILRPMPAERYWADPAGTPPCKTGFNMNERKGSQHGDKQDKARLEVYYRRRVWRLGLCS